MHCTIIILYAKEYTPRPMRPPLPPGTKYEKDQCHQSQDQIAKHEDTEQDADAV